MHWSPLYLPACLARKAGAAKSSHLDRLVKGRKLKGEVCLQQWRANMRVCHRHATCHQPPHASALHTPEAGLWPCTVLVKPVQARCGPFMQSFWFPVEGDHVAWASVRNAQVPKISLFSAAPPATSIRRRLSMPFFLPQKASYCCRSMPAIR